MMLGAPTGGPFKTLHPSSAEPPNSSPNDDVRPDLFLKGGKGVHGYAYPCHVIINS